jgi:hypothetical protein
VAGRLSEGLVRGVKILVSSSSLSSTIEVVKQMGLAFRCSVVKQSGLDGVMLVRLRIG